MGKVFAIVGTFQALVPFASSPLFGFLYRGTVATFPAAFLFLVAGIKLVEAIVVLAVYVGIKSDLKKEKKLATGPQDNLQELGKLMLDDDDKKQESLQQRLRDSEAKPCAP